MSLIDESAFEATFWLVRIYTFVYVDNKNINNSNRPSKKPVKPSHIHVYVRNIY